MDGRFATGAGTDDAGGADATGLDGAMRGVGRCIWRTGTFTSGCCGLEVLTVNSRVSAEVVWNPGGKVRVAVNWRPGEISFS